jgi:peroxiredoxin
MMLLTTASRFATGFFATLLLANACLNVASAAEAKPEIDPTADGRMQAMSKYVGGLERFSVDVDHAIEVPAEDGEVQRRSDRRRVVLEQPNRLAVTTSAGGDGEGTVICDGKQLFAYWPSGQRYLLVDAPETFSGVLQEEAAVLLGAGRTAVQYATGDWYKQATASASKISLLVPEEVDGVACDRIEVSQQRVKIVLWIEQGEHALPRKMEAILQIESAGAESKLPKQVVTYANWELEPEVTDETFAIEVPEDAEQVDSLQEEEPSDEAPHPLLGAEAPDCELKLLEGGSQKLSDLKDKKVAVIDFWALWCGPCVAALPTVDQVAAKFAGRDVAFFAVNLGDEESEIREFLAKEKLKLPIAVDPESELGDLFDADSIPMTIIVDKQGVVQVVSIGAEDDLEQKLAEKIEAVLAGKQLAADELKAARDAQRGGAPIPAGKEAFTAKDAAESQLAFNLRTCVEAYKEFGSRDDAWDEAAIEFLTEAARHFSSAKGFKSQVELIAMAEPLAEQGCDDPMVMYCHGAMLQDGMADAESQAKALKLIEDSYHGLVERGYPANRPFAAANRVYRALKDDASQAEKAEEFLALSEKYALEAILLDDLETNDGRTLYNHLNALAESLPPERREKFCEAAQAHEAKSPFVVNMLVGEHHLDAAWKSRGGSFASEVSEEGWKGFSEHMDLARDAFEKAWKAAPKRPEAATAMVKIAMGHSPSPDREMRMWFDRAVQSQLDYRTPYSHLICGLQPRWHGSHDRMYQFAVECMETERYDTDVPYEFCDAVWQIIRDNQNPLGQRYAERPGLYENARKVCQGYIAQGEDRNALWWKTVWIGFAYLNQEWEEAARLLDELDGKLDADALSRFPLPADGVIETVRLHASPHADEILAAFRAADDGQREEAVDALKAILNEKDLDSAIAAQVASRMQGLEWSAEFQEGAPVAIMPAVDLQGWKVIAGEWSRTPSGELHGVSDGGGVILECQANVGTHWQLSGEVFHGKSPYNPWDAGAFLCVDGRPLFAMMFNPTERWAAAGPYQRLREHRQPFARDGRSTKFVLRVAGDTVNVWLNDVQVIENQEVTGLSTLATGRVAIGAKYTWAGSNLTYRNLEIELVDPEEAEAKEEGEEEEEE